MFYERKDRDDLKKINLTIASDEEKVKALRLYLEKKDCKLEDELTKLFETLYTKIVPAEVRGYISMSNGEEPAPAPIRTRRPKQKEPQPEDDPKEIPAEQIQDTTLDD